MAEQFVGKASEIKDGDRRIVFVGEHEIGVFKEKGEYFAYSNFCLHQGGRRREAVDRERWRDHQQNGLAVVRVRRAATMPP